MIREQHQMETVLYGWPNMTATLRAQGYAVNGKRVRRVLRQMGVQAITVRKWPVTSTPGHRLFPGRYLIY